MREKALEEAGWTMTCESPLEIEHSDGSTATGQGADIVIDSLIADYESENAIKVFKDLSGEQIDDLVDEWHEGDDKKPLHEFLGMTLTQYERWMHTGKIEEDGSEGTKEG